MANLESPVNLTGKDAGGPRGKFPLRVQTRCLLAVRKPHYPPALSNMHFRSCCGCILSKHQPRNATHHCPMKSLQWACWETHPIIIRWPSEQVPVLLLFLNACVAAALSEPHPFWLTYHKLQQAFFTVVKKYFKESSNGQEIYLCHWICCFYISLKSISDLS